MFVRETLPEVIDPAHRIEPACSRWYLDSIEIGRCRSVTHVRAGRKQ